MISVSNDQLCVKPLTLFNSSVCIIDQHITLWSTSDQNFDPLQADNILSEAESLGREGLAAAVKREGPDCFESKSLADVLAKAGHAADRSALLSLVRQITGFDMFMYMGALASGLRELARDDDEYASLVSDIASKARGDLAQGPFTDALVRVGSSSPDTAIRIARRLVKSGDADYASLLVGGAWPGAPAEAAALADELLSSPGDREIAAGVRCMRVGLCEHGTPAAGYVLDRVENALERGGEEAAGEAMEALLDMYDGESGRAGRMVEEAAKRHTRCRATLAHRIRRRSTFDDEASLRHLAACAGDWGSPATVRETHYALAVLAETRPAEVAGIVEKCLADGHYHAEYTGHVLQAIGKKRPDLAIKALLGVARLRPAWELPFLLPEMIRDVAEHADRESVCKMLLDSFGGEEPAADNACLIMLNTMVTENHDALHDGRLSSYVRERLRERASAQGIDADRVTGGRDSKDMACSALIHAMQHRPASVDRRTVVDALESFPAIKRLFTRDWLERMLGEEGAPHPLIGMLAQVQGEKAAEPAAPPAGESEKDRFNRESRARYESHPGLRLGALDAQLVELEKRGQGAAGYVRRMKNPEQFYDTLSEIAFVAPFAARHAVAIEPRVGEKRLDALIKIGPQTVYVEVFRPRMHKELELLEGMRGVPTDRAGGKIFEKLKNQLASAGGLGDAIIVAIDISDSEVRQEQIDDYVLGPEFFTVGIDTGLGRGADVVVGRDEKDSMHCRDDRTDIISAVVCFRSTVSPNGEYGIAGTIRANPHARVTLSRSTLREIEEGYLPIYEW